MIESLNARFRQAVRRRGHFPTDEAALKVLYLVIRDRRKNRPNVVGHTPRLETSPAAVRPDLRRPHHRPHRKIESIAFTTKVLTLPLPGPLRCGEADRLWALR
ncbi:transposase [Nocardia gamkensis]